MYKKEELQELKAEFWREFANKYPRKWMLYDTKIKDFSFKFYLDNKKIEVLLAIENKDLELRKIYFQKIESLKTILTEEYIPEVEFDFESRLKNNKVIAKIWVEKNISFHNKANWNDIFDYFYEKMDTLERFFFEYEDYIRDLDINT
ncbi:MAG: DUF4268 domain-containing protein [Bacteroidota bacterium]|nr:DUF4268 domain-containing protein [Bacteroidota bacterium]